METLSSDTSETRFTTAGTRALPFLEGSRKEAQRVDKHLVVDDQQKEESRPTEHRIRCSFATQRRSWGEQKSKRHREREKSPFDLDIRRNASLVQSREDLRRDRRSSDQSGNLAEKSIGWILSRRDFQMARDSQGHRRDSSRMEFSPDALASSHFSQRFDSIR